MKIRFFAAINFVLKTLYGCLHQGSLSFFVPVSLDTEVSLIRKYPSSREMISNPEKRREIRRYDLLVHIYGMYRFFKYSPKNGDVHVYFIFLL